VIEEDGRQYWVYEDRRQTNMGLNAVAGTPKELWANDPIRFSDMIPGCYDPKARAKDMRADGIFASVNFPTLPRFGGALFPTFKDMELADVCVQAWNDFVIDEWCTAVPGMYVPMIICQLWDPRLAANEIRRCAERGARALSFVEDPSLLGMPSFHTDHWDPVWKACEETQTAICLHLSSSGSTFLSDDVPPAVEIAASFTKAANAAVNLMFSPLPRKYPRVQIVWSEGGIGWVPSALERADRQYLRHRFWTHLDEGLPSDICRQTMWFCTIEEPQGVQARYQIGVDRIVWECDYPHSDSTWPESQKIVAEVFADVPRDEVDMITHQNALRLFRWEMPKEADAAA
jgi:predicted TIM-barrel fold metal-dependent hydrolase